MFGMKWFAESSFLGACLVVALGAVSPVSADFICQKNSNGSLTVRPACLRGESKIKNLDSLTGAQGATGATGAAGAQGATGATGAAGSSGFGTITGVYLPTPQGCAVNNQPHLHGRVEIGGTSYSASFLANGSFAIYGVLPGTYTLSLTELAGNSFATTSMGGFGTSIANNVVVTAGSTTNVGTIIGTNSCCGNSLVEGAEQCDTQNLNGATCVSRGFGGGTLSCYNNCFFNTEACTQ